MIIEKHSYIFSGSFWRESKLVLARSYASATQATMAFAPSVELHLNPKHSFSPHEPFHSTLTVSPSLTSKLNEQSRSIINNSNIDQITGTLFVLSVVLLSVCVCSARHLCFEYFEN
jgi:hypothetical protein